MPILWTPRLSVGVSWIDDEHKELFARVNQLLDASQALRGRQEVKPVLDFLTEYVNHHFDHEQRQMERLAYPGMAEHLDEHAYFVESYLVLAAEVERNGPSAMVTVKLNRLLCDWLREHVGSTDRRLGAFVTAAGGERSA
jgi:hemerythrin